jgi:hypothetical protein
MLFKSTANALRKAASNPSFLGVESGCVSVLHTWGQSLNYHPHIHMLVPAGGIDGDGQEWIASSKKFFVPVSAISKIFRGTFYQWLMKALEKEELQVPDQDACMYKDHHALKCHLYEKLWHVHIKKTFKGAGQVVSYLGRYTHRVAISNSRLISLSEGMVKFRWKDYRDQRWKIMELKATCFIQRFLQHILPCGYYKIRYYGIFSSIHAKTTMQQCFALLRSSPSISQYEGLEMSEVLYLITGHDVAKCPQCTEGRMIVAQPFLAEVT